MSGNTSPLAVPVLAVVAFGVAWLHLASGPLGGARTSAVIGLSAADVLRVQSRLNAQKDADARQVLAEYESRLWNPARDAGVRKAQGTATVTVDGRSGTFRVRFDGSLPKNAQVQVEQVTAEPGLHEGALAQCKRFAILALLGPYHTTLLRIPNTPIRLEAGSNGPLVWVPLDGGSSVSYAFDRRSLVAVRGEGSASGTSGVISRFRWMDWQGRAVLIHASEDLGDAAKPRATTTYVHDLRRGFPLLIRATLREAPHVADIEFQWKEIVGEGRD